MLHPSSARVLALTRVVGALGFVCMILAVAPALSQAAELRVLANPKGLATGKTVRVTALGTGPGFEAMVGVTDVTARFERAGKAGRRVAVLRRGVELRRGENRIVVGSGKGSKRRYAATKVVLGAKLRGSLELKRRSVRPGAALLAVRGPRGGFDRVRVRVNGKLLTGRSWVVGKRTRAGDWPLARRSFQATLSARDGLRRGQNKVVMTAWRDDGSFGRARLTLRMPRLAPLPDAGPSRRTEVGSGARLDGRGTRALPGKGLRYHWRIVRAPRGSKARLRGAASARPRLLTDRAGRYRVRLVATSPARQPAAAQTSRLQQVAAMDETTVVAAPSTEPIGAQVETMAKGGIEVGEQLYPAGDGWAQLVVLDRTSLELESNRTFGSGSSVSIGDVGQLNSALRSLRPDQLAIVSGGGRQVSAPVEETTFGSAFASVIEAAGGNPAPLGEWARAWGQVFQQGNWSIVGSPVPGTAYQNLFGSIFGATAGAGSRPGALTGYLQLASSELYGFVAGQYAAFDTQVPGAAPGVNKIRIGEDVYTSEQIQSGFSGFHVLVLDSMLERTTERTFVTSGPLESLEPGVNAMQEMINQVSTPGLGAAPGYLVIVQSIGNPQASTVGWVNDQALVENEFGHHQNALIPRGESTWYASKSSGESLAGALGGLGGPLAHDHVAQMTSLTMSEPKPRGAPGGYTLVASVGSWGEEGPVDPASVPVSRLQAVAPPKAEARLTGTLSRDRQTFWSVDSASWLEGAGGESVGELIFEPPTPWPLSSTPAQIAANSFIAKQLKLKWKDVREAYWQDTAKSPTTLQDEVEGVAFESGNGFAEATFLAVRKQLASELEMVSNVDELVSGWERIFAKGEKAGRIDLTAVAKPVYKAIEELDSLDSNSMASAESMVAESTWVAASLLTFAGQDELAAPLGVFASALDWGSSLSSSSADTGPEAGLVEAKASELATALSERFLAIQERLSLIRSIYLTDWGKLKTASERTGNEWSLEAKALPKLTRSMELATKREFTAALLSTLYGIYVVDPEYIDDDFQRPAGIRCIAESGISGYVAPFDDAEANQSSWISHAVGFSDPNPEVAPNVIQRATGLTRVADASEGYVSSHASSVPEAITGPLFAAIEPGSSVKLGEDPLAFFADPRFAQRWFYCDSAG